MLDVIKISSREGFLEKNVLHTSSHKNVLKDICTKDCMLNYGVFPRRTKYGFYFHDSDFDITVYYIIRPRVKGKTVL